MHARCGVGKSVACEEIGERTLRSATTSARSRNARVRRPRMRPATRHAVC